MSTLSELKEEVAKLKKEAARLKKLKEDIKSRKENEANQIKAKTKELEVFFEEFKEAHHTFYQRAFVSSLIACSELPKIEDVYALTFDIVFKLSLFIAFKLDNKNILKDNDYLFSMLFKKHFNCDYWTENNKHLLEAKKDFEEHIKKYSVFLICKDANEIENLKKRINPILELFYDFCRKTLKRKSFKRNDIDFNNFMSNSEINDNKSIDLDEYINEANDFNYKISKKLNLINDDSERNNILKSVRLFIEPTVTDNCINSCFDVVSQLWPMIEEGIFIFLKEASVDRNKATIIVSNIKLNCYLIFCVKLYEIDKEIFKNSSQILKLKKYILGSAVSDSCPEISEENTVYFLDSYKKGTSSYMFLNKFINVYADALEKNMKNTLSKFGEDVINMLKNEVTLENSYNKVAQSINMQFERVFSYYFVIFDLLTAYIDKNTDLIKKEFRELISFDAFDDFTADEYVSLLKDDFYYKTLSEKTTELYKRFSID